MILLRYQTGCARAKQRLNNLTSWQIPWRAPWHDEALPRKRQWLHCPCSPSPGIVQARVRAGAADFDVPVVDRVVSVSAVVRDRKGRFVENLERKDFIVAEAGQPRPILDFRAEADGPVKLAMLFDISGSMRVGTKAVDARQAARHVLGALRPGDEAAVFSFDTRLDRVTPFTSDLTKLEAALAHVKSPYGQTSMYDAIAETARWSPATGQARDGSAAKRRGGVDRWDRHAQPPHARSRSSTIASSIDIPVYIVAVMSPIDDPRRPDGRGRNDWSAAGPGALDRRRDVRRKRAGACEPRGAADRGRTSAPIRPRVRSVERGRMAPAGSAGARSAR